MRGFPDPSVKALASQGRSTVHVFFLCLIALAAISGCIYLPPGGGPVAEYTQIDDTDAGFCFTDDLGLQVILPSRPERVASLMGSYSELWLLAGGELAGVTEDAFSERALELDDSVRVIGSVSQPNLELILDLSPDLILMSADQGSHRELDAFFTQSGLVHAYFKVDDVYAYVRVLGLLTGITGRADLFAQYGESTEKRVEAVLQKITPDTYKPKVLLIRSMSTTAKALKEDHMTGIMLADLGTVNIASTYGSLLEDLSLEAILDADPDFIFVITTGDAQKALQTLESGLMANPAWGSLSAVQNARCHILPKELFHYKPNARWGESYEYLYEILYL